MHAAGSPPVAGSEHVSANYRYIAAYNELVARINQRQQTLTLFVAIFTGLVTALVAGRELFSQRLLSLDWLMVGFPTASISLTWLNSKYERLLSLLRGYLGELERVGDAHLRLPSYNRDAGLMAQANTARRGHDLTCAALILAYNIVALGIFCSITPPSGAGFYGVVVGVSVVALATAFAQLRLTRFYFVPRAG